MFSPVFLGKGATFSAAAAAGCLSCWPRCPLAGISDSGRYFEMSLSVSPGHVAKDQYLIVWNRERFVGQQRI